MDAREEPPESWEAYCQTPALARPQLACIPVSAYVYYPKKEGCKLAGHLQANLAATGRTTSPTCCLGVAPGARAAALVWAHLDSIH